MHITLKDLFLSSHGHVHEPAHRNSYTVMLHRHEAPYTAMMAKKTWKSVAHPSDVSPPRSRGSLFFSNNNGPESSAAAALACALVPSEKTDTRPGNEGRMLKCHHAVRKNTHAGLQRLPSANVPSCGQKRHTRWPATSWPSADVPWCGQKRHTRWPATNFGWWCVFVPSETGQGILGLKDFRVKRF